MTVTGTRSDTRLAEMLRRTQLFPEDQISALLQQQREESISLTAAVVNFGYAPEETFLKALAEVMGLPFLRLSDDNIDTGILDRLPTRAVFQYNVIPVAAEPNCLRVATSDPFHPGLVDALRLGSGQRIRLALSPSDDIAKASKKFYGVGAETVEKMIQDDRIEVSGEGFSKTDLSEMDQEASIVKFVNQVIWEAYQDNATDIHMEPMETELRIRYRIDGVLHQTPVPPHLKRIQSAVLSRIKVMSNMDIAEKRLPQDGRISLRVKGEEIDVRVSTMPTVYGESVSLRLLRRDSGMLRLDKLGLLPEDEKLLSHMIHKPHGILLNTGPTGSGKSTSLYAWLHTINTLDKRIITVEDPIEYEMPGVNQVQMRSEIGLTFARGLRHILRQDPDVIMVGEIRDKETAEIAIRAALTGHLVFSTLHTNDAAGAVTRLVDMGIEPFLVASSVEGLVAQRLVRRLCIKCRRPIELNMDYLRECGFPVDRLQEGRLYEAGTCEACRNTGFHGRTGIYEIIAMNDNLRRMVIERESSTAIKSAALRGGMRTLRDDGWTKALAGVTTVEEILRVSDEDEELSETSA
jgi:type II secretion system protein E